MMRMSEHSSRTDRQARKRTTTRRGAHAVEFAVVAAVMFVFILGLVEVGRAFMVQHLLTNAARQGCRVGILPGKANSDVIAMVNSTLTAQGIRGDTATVQVNDNSADVANANSGDEVTVSVSVPVSSVTWLPGSGFLRGSIASKYTLRRE
jgi:Flp pilus assembly protein TadG